jgi:hypothetical protein
MHQIPFIFDDCLDLTLTHLTMVGGLTGCPSKLIPIGFGLPPGGFLKSHCPLPSYHHFYILSPAHLSHSPSPGIRMICLWGCTLSRGKKGLKAQKVKVVGKR